MTDFIHLHSHSEYSLLDGMSTPEEMVKIAADLGQKAISITDHGTMAGTFRLSQAAEKAGIKPILGVEAYYVPSLVADTDDKKAERFHLILLAKNQEGLNKLNKVMRRAWTEGYYYKPRIEWADLAHLAGDVVCLSGCMASHLSRLLMNDDARAPGLAMQFHNLFKDDYYIEVQPWSGDEHTELSAKLIDLAYGLNIPMVGTADCHFPTANEAGIEEVLLAVGQYPGLGAAETRYIRDKAETARDIIDLTDKINHLMPDRRLRFDAIAPYIMSGDEISKMFRTNLTKEFSDEIFTNTVEIADKCNASVRKRKGLLPKFQKNTDSNEMLREIAFKGLEKVSSDTIYTDRLEMELNVIERLDFADYFLVIWDLVSWAKNSGIRVGPGRGSVGGSLLAYAIGITQVDPIKHGLLFARFLDEERGDFPDIDLDFEDKKRYKVKEYLKKRWGEDHVAGISTFSTFQPKGVVKDVSRVLGIEYARVNKLTPLFDTFDELKTNPKTKGFAEEYPEVLNIGRKLSGRVKGAGAHAAGMVVSSRPLYEIVPVETRKDEASDGRVEVAAFDMNEVADIGLIKFDVLGLKALAIIEDCISTIRSLHGEDVEHRSLGIDDPAVFADFNKGDTVGIFQVEAGAYTRLLQEMGISSFADLAVSNALVRPGALVTQGASYLAAKSGAVPVESIHPLVDSILEETYGTVVYQEQLMNVAQAIGGFTVAQSNKLRKIIGKKRDAAEFEPFKEQFIDTASKLIPKTRARKMWSDFEKSSEYMFNKSHAVAYSLLSYQTAWLKHYYPTEFIWASLVNEDDQSRISTLLLTANKMGVKILPPDVNESADGFALLNDNTIRFGLRNVMGCGDTAIKELLAKRPFMSIEDFRGRCAKNKVRKNVVENLEKVDAFASLGYHAPYEYEKYYLPVLNYPVYADSDTTFANLISKCAEVDAEAKDFQIVKGVVKATKRKPTYFKLEIEDATGSVEVFGPKDAPIRAKDYICAMVGDSSLVGYCDATQLDDMDDNFVQFLTMLDSGELPEDIAEATTYGAGSEGAPSVGIVLSLRSFVTKKTGMDMGSAYIYDPINQKINKITLFPRLYKNLSPLLTPMNKIIYRKEPIKGSKDYCFDDIITVDFYLELKREYQNV